MSGIQFYYPNPIRNCRVGYPLPDNKRPTPSFRENLGMIDQKLPVYLGFENPTENIEKHRLLHTHDLIHQSLKFHSETGNSTCLHQFRNPSNGSS